MLRYSLNFGSNVINLPCGYSVSSVRDCLGSRLLTSGPRSLALNSSAANRARVTYLAGTESHRRFVSTAGPNRMALGRRAPLGDSVHY